MLHYDSLIPDPGHSALLDDGHCFAPQGVHRHTASRVQCPVSRIKEASFNSTGQWTQDACISALGDTAPRSKISSSSSRSSSSGSSSGISSSNVAPAAVAVVVLSLVVHVVVVVVVVVIIAMVVVVVAVVVVAAAVAVGEVAKLVAAS